MLEGLLCRGCQSHKLMVWKAIRPGPGVTLPMCCERVAPGDDHDGRLFAIHCAYLGKRVEWASLLEQCDAFKAPENRK